MSLALDHLHRHFPQALSTVEASERFLALVQQELGLLPHQVMHADSICCDDLNSIEYPAAARAMLGPFNMGGLNGFPFAGRTGMAAFAHHAPEDGALFLFYGPHLGLTEAGEVGFALRPGQREASACCGAAQLAVGRLQRGEIIPGYVEELDYQQHQLEQLLLRAEARILSSPEPLKAATEVMFEAIDARIELLLSQTKLPCPHLILLGCTLINGDHHLGSFCQVHKLDHVEVGTGRRSDWRARLHAP